MYNVPKRIALAIFTTVGLAGHGGCGKALPAEPAEATVAGEASLEETADYGRRRTVSVRLQGFWENTELPPDGDPPAGCLVGFATTQVGQANLLGRFEGTGSTCVLSQVPTQDPPFWHHDQPAPPYGLAEFSNEMVWTAANGDELRLRPNGGLFVLSFANGASSVRGQLTVSGGTGRFREASGQLQVRGGRGPGETGDRVEFEGRIYLWRGERARGHRGR